MSFSGCDLANTWGIMYCCDVFNANEKQIPIQTYINTINWAGIKPYSRLYFNTYYIRQIYLAYIRNFVRVPIFLFTGHSDTDTTLDDTGVMDMILNDDRIVLWFSQNCVTDHPKCVGLPIGIDYHTLATVGLDSWGPKMSPVDQEFQLMTIAHHSRRYDRKMMCYANFHFNTTNIRYGYERDAAIRKVPSDLVYYEPNFAKRADSWKKQAEYWFVLSPPGNGIDCHRTWEALALGCYPIIKRTNINGVFDGLPVVVVDDWSDVTEALLKEKLDEFKGKAFNMERITLAYWRGLIDERCNKSIQDAAPLHKP